MTSRILIVDDSAVVRAVLKKTILMTEVPVGEILQAANGKQALEIMQQQPIDLVFADLNMPEMNGLEMARHVLCHDNIAHKPAIVVVTTEASAARIEELKDIGVKAYVHKPFTPEQIRNVLTMQWACC